MELVDNLTKEEYENFFKKSKYNHFLQSYAWGQTCTVRVQTPVYLGLKDDNGNIVAACLAMRKDIPFRMTYFYAPRGPLIDYDNYELLEAWTNELKKYLKKQNAVYFRLDPGVVYEEIDEEARPIEGGKNNHKVYEDLVKLGYTHRGFTTLFTRNQPRYTFRIDTKRPIEEIEKDMNKTYLKTIKRSYNYDLEISDYYDTDTFYDLMKNIAAKDGFNGNPKNFFQKFSEEFGKTNTVHYISVKIYPDKEIAKAKEALDKLQKELDEGKVLPKHMADTQNQIARFQKDIETFSPYEGKYPDGLISLILICPYTDRNMWTLYIGNNSLATYTFAVNRAYYEAIKYAVDKGFDFLDLFGTCGEPHSTDKNYAALHEYKRKLGGTYTCFIGEFDIINKKLWYKFLPTFLKWRRKLKGK